MGMRAAVSRNRRCAVLVLALVAGGAGPAGAVIKSSVFRVSVTVVAPCAVIPKPAMAASVVCTRTPRPATASSVDLPTPVVTYSRDPATGLVWETIEF